jgi:indole-3-glycerol phosphate synthase
LYGMGSYLDPILAYHRARAASDDRSRAQLLKQAEKAADRPDFGLAIAKSGISLIAEFKRRSPSKGLIASAKADPVRVAQAYERGGASCVSVLTDEPHFGGSSEDLRRVADAVNLPVLRKDFVVQDRDVVDARIWGASAVLIIVAALSDAELDLFARVAGDVGIATLCEVHDASELERVDPARYPIIGINQRNLRSFEVDEKRAADLKESLPAGTLAVAESGVTSRDDVIRIAKAGFDAVLIGEYLMRSDDPELAVSELLEGVS